MSESRPAELGSLLRLPHNPNDEQSHVIGLSRDGVHLVLAGAGSGKTETMSMRALWLIARGGVRPEEVLGLTFTRKAARELDERFRLRIGVLRRERQRFADSGFDVSHLSDDDHGFATPTVSTYNAFASEIFRQHAARIGWDADAPVITTATAYAIARDVVVRSPSEHLAAFDFSIGDITDAVIRLASELREFAVTDDEAIVSFVREFGELSSLPNTGTKDELKALAQIEMVRAIEFILPIAREFIAEKKRLGVVEFSDQVVFAREILNAFPDIVKDYRERFKVVILDEYQDTSFAQTQLFASLFPSERVTAVGDPNQSIYGWRGASPANVARFHADFAANDGDRRPNELITSWRNGLTILKAANTLLEPFDGDPRAVPVSRLKSFDGASDNPITAKFVNHTTIEARELGAWFLSHLKTTSDTNPPTMAMLVRTRTHLDDFLIEFDKLNVPYRLVGVSGILGNPFVADLYCALSVIAEPMIGQRLVRLLGGARWQISVADLWALQAHAANIASAYTSREHKDKFGKSLVADEGSSVIDALDSLRYTERSRVEFDPDPLPDDDPRKRDKKVAFSPDGWERLLAAAEFFHSLRQHVDLAIPDIVRMTSEALRLDIEGRASIRRNPRAHLEAFDDLVHGYLSIPANHSLRGFIEWVGEVEKHERTTPRSDEPEPGVVQILTIHSAKGLEWDVVALPRWVRADAGRQTKSANKMGWLQLGALPHDFRGDKEFFPVLPWRTATTMKDFVALASAYSRALKDTLILPEERRLAYVGVTRARHHLWISGSWFEGDGTTPKKPNRFWEELAAKDLVPRIDPSGAPGHDSIDTSAMFTWPARDPLGSIEHRQRYDVAAHLVTNSTGNVHSDDLVAMEHLMARGSSGAAHIPVRIPASRYAEWAMDVAKTREGSRRPIPVRPYRAARLGTEMHLWIERGRLDDDFVDGFREPDDVVETDEQLDALKEIYLSSRWAGLSPLHREIEILLPQGKHIVVCKIDAVFHIDGRFVVVDWKTGAKPETEEEKNHKAMQLVLYRRALAALYGIDVSHIDAILYYIAHDWEWKIEPERLAELDARPFID